MDLVAALGGLEPAVAVFMIALLPYAALATGRLVPRSSVKDWKDAYFKSEEARAIDRETTGTLLKYAETTDHLLRTALGPGLPPNPRGPSELDS